MLTITSIFITIAVLRSAGIVECKGKDSKGYDLPATKETGWANIPGVPGMDYPVYKKLPNTTFTCAQHGFTQGFYADLATQCQVYHICYQKRTSSFLCPAGTMFDQRILTCDFWYNVDCQSSSLFYPSIPADENEQKFSPGSSKGDDSDSDLFFVFQEIGGREEYTKGKTSDRRTLPPAPYTKGVTLATKAESTTPELQWTTEPVTDAQTTFPTTETLPDASTYWETTPESTTNVPVETTSTKQPSTHTKYTFTLSKNITKVKFPMEQANAKPKPPAAKGIQKVKQQLPLKTMTNKDFLKGLDKTSLIHAKMAALPSIKVAFAQYLKSLHDSKRQSLDNLWRTFLHYYLRPHLQSGLLHNHPLTKFQKKHGLKHQSVAKMAAKNYPRG